MITLIRQESYKLLKQRGTQIFLAGLFIFQLFVVFMSKKYPKFMNDKDAFLNNYLAIVPITFFIIAICSTVITQERQFGTLRSLLYRKYSYIQVITSKIVTLVGFTIALFVGNALVSLLFKFIFANKVELTHKIMKTWLLTNLNDFLTLFFLMGLVILLGTLINNSNLALIIGIGGYFVINVFNQILLALVAKFDWLKWNPLNMMNLGEQIQSHSLHQMTQLSMTQISIGYVIYVSLFIILAVYSFCKKSV
ncbi:ABC transporter permease [Companilactobacillus sp. HBUAS56275]|uniref:ABC transporter permease n=1 Tax=Candidatus Companilactobacillus pullicola TaxID=2838523 RepID=A0A9D2CPY9_9LACO|nr:ABC transporter permease [Candidatus Companilactobacillus pullicola]